MEEYPPAPKQNKFTALAFLEVGLFEIGFVTILLFLFFGTLNYFNILPVSDVFPKYLSWLPRREVPSGTFRQTQQQEELLYTPANPTPTPAVFTYDTKKAETLLTQYIKDNIKQEFVPNKTEVKQGRQIDGTDGPDYGFDWYYKTSNLTISSNFQFTENTNTNSSFSIFIQPSNIQEKTVTTSIASSLTLLYFNNPFSISNCQTKGATSYCESFKTESNGKRGFGIVFGYEGTKLVHIAFTCFIPRDSKDYPTQQSCISP